MHLNGERFFLKDIFATCLTRKANDDKISLKEIFKVSPENKIVLLTNS
jgi:hypothetical protein